ncbi:MAG TPA: hypothetical protein VF718_13080 [Allosphingosinicella sp.]
MIEETRNETRPEEAAESARKAWSEPRIEAIRGSDAAASFRGGANIDYGIYS